MPHLTVFNGSKRPLVSLSHHNNPTGSIVAMCCFPESVQVSEGSREYRLPPVQRHFNWINTAHS